MTTNPALEAAAYGRLVELLDKLRELATSDNYANLPQHLAAAALTADLETLGDAHVIASALANVLISEARTEQLPPMITTEDDKVYDHRYAGVEIRLIGPAEACRNVLADINAGPVKLTEPRGPVDADHPGREGQVRYYTYTDETAKKTARLNARRASRARKNGTHQ